MPASALACLAGPTVQRCKLQGPYRPMQACNLAGPLCHCKPDFGETCWKWDVVSRREWDGTRGTNSDDWFPCRCMCTVLQQATAESLQYSQWSSGSGTAAVFNSAAVVSSPDPLQDVPHLHTSDESRRLPPMSESVWNPSQRYPTRGNLISERLTRG